MDPISGPLGIAAVIVLLLGCALLWFALHSLLDRRHWSNALGNVVSHGPVQPAESVGRSSYRYPMEVGFEFRAEDGQTYRFAKTLDAADVIPDYNIGAVVVVRYRAEDPRATADPNPSGAFAGAIFMLMLGLLLVLPTALYAGIQYGFLEGIFARRALDNSGFVLCASAGVAVFLVPALALAISRWQFLSGAAEAQLRVIGFQKDAIVLSQHESESGGYEASTEAEYTQFELISPNRPVLRIAERLPSRQGSRPYTAGQVLQVLYPPQDPGHWIRDRWTSRWLGAVILGGAGLLLIGIGWLLRPSPKQLADQAAIEKAFDRLDSAHGEAERSAASRAVFEAVEKAEPAPAADTVVSTFAPEKLGPVVSLWKGIVRGGSPDFYKSYSLKATEPMPERWPAQVGDGIVYYVFPSSRAMPEVENRAEPIARVMQRAGKSPRVEPLAQSLVPLGSVAVAPPGKAETEAESREAVQVARAWVAQKRSFASLRPSALDALKQYYCQRLDLGDPVLSKVLRQHHADFLQWLSCPP